MTQPRGARVLESERMTRGDAATMAEDLTRWLVVRATMAVGMILLVGLPSADLGAGLTAAAAVVGALAFFLPPLGLMMRWPRTAQWLVSGSLLLGSGALLAVLVHRR